MTIHWNNSLALVWTSPLFFLVWFKKRRQLQSKVTMIGDTGLSWLILIRIMQSHSYFRFRHFPHWKITCCAKKRNELVFQQECIQKERRKNTPVEENYAWVLKLFWNEFNKKILLSWAAVLDAKRSWKRFLKLKFNILRNSACEDP